MQENIQDAESTIRDTDVADEMMAYTKNNILIQSAQGHAGPGQSGASGCAAAAAVIRSSCSFTATTRGPGTAPAPVFLC